MPGHGFLTEDGRYYTEGDVRRMMDVAHRFFAWWNGLSEETRDILTDASRPQ